MMALSKDALRRIVHGICGKKGLALTAEQRHDMQRDVIGKASLADMTVSELEDLVTHLRTLQRLAQAKEGQEWRFVFGLPAERQVFGRKIYRLAERAGALMDPPRPVASKAYIEGIASHMRGCETVLQFCDAEQLRAVMVALTKHCNRNGV